MLTVLIFLVPDSNLLLKVYSKQCTNAMSIEHFDNVMFLRTPNPTENTKCIIDLYVFPWHDAADVALALPADKADTSQHTLYPPPPIDAALSRHHLDPLGRGHLPFHAVSCFLFVLCTK